METILSQLRKAVDDAKESGWSINAIAREAEINRTSLQEWYSGSRESLAAETVARLAAWFGMRLTRPKIKRPPSPERPTANRQPPTAPCAD